MGKGWRFEFKYQDFWIGAFWETYIGRTDLYICLVPMFPIHIWWTK